MHDNESLIPVAINPKLKREKLRKIMRFVE